MNFRILLSMFALLLFSSFPMYASFPVENALVNGSSQTTISQSTVEPTLSSPAAVGSGKSQIVALVLALVVGGLGIHRFYLGYIWQGVVQLLTLGGFGIWALIDLIRIITGDLQPKDGSYSETL
ncbi:TM2 domain-containing protein [Flavobacterium sp.]|uniref:TM2 domain-containing protein n=1 Tax=Flavobacterium sp. TaxID=239 RepID=UPI0025C20AF5|nr:TM2 domain-containing protein [Flavobacterium sp.]MBA4277575.1 TM2 domain-containing protein [Flavobacterium sp.]